MDIKIRKLKKEDAIKTSNLIKKVQLVTLIKYYHKDIIDYFVEKNTPKNIIRESKENNMYVAEFKNKIVGILSFKDNEIKLLYIHPDFQRKGIGRKLFAKYMSLTKKFKKHIIYSSIPGEAAYLKYGYKKIKKIYKQKNNQRYYNIYMEIKWNT